MRRPVVIGAVQRPTIIGAAGYDENMFPPIPAWYTALSAAGTVVGAYHGYKRNNSIGWGVGWALLGGAFPFIVLPLAVAQGVGKRKGR